MMRPLDRRNVLRLHSLVPSGSDVTHPAVSLIVGHGPSAQRVSGSKLLIGADPQCDIRMDGIDAPEIHSIVHRDRDGIWLDVLAQEMPAFVNGHETQWSKLHDRDVVRIGGIEMTVQVEEQRVGAIAPLKSAAGASKPALLRLADADESSAPARRIASGTALLQAALQRAIPQRLPGAWSGVETAPGVLPLSAVYSMESARGESKRRRNISELVSQLEQLAARAELLARDLEDRADDTQAPDWNFLIAADHLLDQLEELIVAEESSTDSDAGGVNPRLAA